MCFLVHVCTTALLMYSIFTIVTSFPFLNFSDMIWRVRRSLSIVLLWATIVLVIVVQRQYLPASRQSDQQLHAELDESIYSAPQQYTSKVFWE